MKSTTKKTEQSSSSTPSQFKVPSYQEGNKQITERPHKVSSNSYAQGLFKSSSGSMKLLPVIKEEAVEGRSKLEEHIVKLRNDAHSTSRSQSPHEQENGCLNNNNVTSLKMEKTVSPVGSSPMP